MGVWGFITLVLQYLLRLNLGVSNASNAIASIHKTDKEYVSRVVGVSVLLLLTLSLIILFTFTGMNYFSISIGEKYSFVKYIPYVIIISVLNHFNLLFSNIFRVYGKLFAIVVNQSALPLGMLLVTFFFKGEDLLWALVIVSVLAALVSFLFYLITSPVSFKPIVDWELVKTVQLKGAYLFLYNACFYLIVISTRSFVSANYSVEEFGLFTFSFTLASTVLLLFQSLSFLIFPKMINRLSKKNNEETIQLLHTLREGYITVTHFCSYIAIFLYPFLIKFFPEYTSTLEVFVVIVLTNALYTNSFGYPGLIIAKEKEKAISFIATCALLLNVLLCWFCVSIIKVSYEYVMLATIVVYFIYTFSIVKYGRGLLMKNDTTINTLKSFLSIKWLLPFILSLVITLFNKDNEWLYILPMIIFAILNYKGFINVFKLAKSILYNPNVIDI